MGDFLILFALLAISAVVLILVVDIFKTKKNISKPPAYFKETPLPVIKQPAPGGDQSLPVKEQLVPVKVLVIPKCGECYLFSNKSGIGIGICKYTTTDIIPFVYYAFRTDYKPHVMHVDDNCCDLKRRQDAMGRIGSDKFATAPKIAMTGEYLKMKDRDIDKYKYLINQVHKEVLQKYGETDRFKTLDSIKYKVPLQEPKKTAVQKSGKK